MSTYIWEAVLHGSFDPGFLVDEHTGKILHANSASHDLFSHTLDSTFDEGGELPKDDRDHIDQYVSFWAFSLTGSDSDEDSTNGKKNEDDEEREDTLKWNQVVKHYNSVAPDEAVEEWKVTGIRPHYETGKRKEDRSFPGALRMTSVGTNAAYWLCFIRHADHLDIIQSGSITTREHGSGTNGSAVRKTRTASASVKKAKEARMAIDADGKILDINFNALELDLKNPKYAWINMDMIGQYIANTPLAMLPSKRLEEERKGNTQRMPKMLDMILESGVEPGHSACPMSGFPINTTGGYVSAMSTGAAQREENITAAAFEAALDPIFQIDEHGKIQMVNSAAVKKFGWKRSEFLGSNISMICGDGHEAKHAGYLARFLATGSTRVIGRTRELVAKKRDGTEFPIELAVVEVDTFAGEVRLFCGFIRDLTKIKAREQLAQEMVKGALDPVFQISQTGTILMVNNAALKKFGYTYEEMIGQNISLICGGSHAQSHDQYLRKYMRTGMTRVIGKYRELPARRKDGMEFLIQLAVVEIQTSSGEERLFCGFVHDLSAQKRAQEIMRGTIDTSLDPVLHINDNGIIQMVNNAACYHLGYDRHELVGENVSVIVGGGHGKHHGKYIEHYLETGEKRAMGKKRKLKARRKDGSELPIELGLSEIRIDGGKELMFCAFLTIISADRMRRDDEEASRRTNPGPTNGKTNGHKESEEVGYDSDADLVSENHSEVVENSEAGLDVESDTEHTN